MSKRDSDGYLKPVPAAVVFTLTIVVVVSFLLLLFAAFLWFLPDDPSLPVPMGAAIAAPFVFT